MAVSREPEFRTTRMREGYDLDAVDDFVDLVIDALEGRGGGRGVTPEQIENEEFKVVRMREGYVMDDVDDWLDAAAAELRKIRKAAQAAQATQAAPAPYAPPQQAPVHPQTAPNPVHPQTNPNPVAAPVAPGPMGAPAGVPPTAPGPMSQPQMAPPTPPATSPGFPPPNTPAQGNPIYPNYYDNEPAVPPHQAGYAAPGTTHGYDPLTDSAVNELDPVLRALDSSYVGEDKQISAPAQSREPAVDSQPLAVSATPSTGLHHVEIWVRDLDAATRSFGWLFERLGWTLFQAWDNGRSWQAPGGGPYVVLECSPDLTWASYDRKAPGLNHLALAVPEQWMVDRIVSEAPAYGWRLMFADRHPHAGGPHHYAAYMENDEGFEVEVVAP